MTKKRSLITILWMSMTFLCIVLVCLLVYLWIGGEIKNTHSQINIIKNTYITSQKEILKTQVKQTIDHIRHQKFLAEKRMKAEVKSRTNEAWTMASYIYEHNKNEKSLTQIKQLVHDALYAASWDDGKGYYFAEDMTGTELVNRNNPELEGVNILNVQDSKGTYLMKEILTVAKSPAKEGFTYYYWNKPDYSGVPVPKISYVKYFPPLDWVIGNGKYIVDEEVIIKKEVLSHIENIKYGDGGYIFAGKWDGLSLTYPFKGENMLHATDPNGIKIVEELIGAAKSGGGYVEYVTPKFKGQNPVAKISYAEPIMEWNWYVGTGLQIDAIENVILHKQIQLKKDIKSLIIKGLTILCLFIFISSILIWFISRKIKNNLDLFVDFFRHSAVKAQPIEKEKIAFTEFQEMAVSANLMAMERQKSEKALREGEEKFRQLFKNAPTGIYEIDLVKNKFTNVNDIMCKLLGYSELEFLSMAPEDLFTDETNTRFKLRFKKLISGEKIPDNIEADLIKKNGKKIDLTLNSDFSVKKGQLKSGRVVAHDISELKLAQEEKINAQRIAGEQKKLALVGQIAGKMAHDFNNVLGIIMGNTELLLMENKDINIERRLELVLKQTLRGRNLTKNLVAFAKDQEPKQLFFRINEKIDLVLSLMKKDLEGIELIKDDKPGVPDLLADPGMIEHALVNLVQNAIHATSMSDDPRIILRTYCVGKNINFEIEDNGCGISKEHLQDIYDPSFTLKGSRDITGSYQGSIRGTGYGMANVQKYVEQHRGSIFVESKVGFGTKFTISLPVIKKELTSEEKVEIKAETFHFEKYILLVEDEVDISDVQYRILTQEPCNNKVDIANNGQVAMDLFDRNAYDLVSLDYILPGNINGMDVYHHIRKTNKTIPILFISGNIDFLESIKDLKQKDANIDHQSKPCQNKIYVNAINKLFEKSFVQPD